MAEPFTDDTLAAIRARPSSRDARWLATLSALQAKLDAANAKLAVAWEKIASTETERDLARGVLTGVREQLSAVNEREAGLCDALRDAAYLDADGCLTGDCPHYNVHDCVAALKETLIEECNKLRAALSSTPAPRADPVGETPC